MSYTLPHTSLTPILGESATYDPTTETTPTFMNGKFTELLENDTGLAQQINVLSESINKKQFLTLAGGWLNTYEGQLSYYSVAGKTLTFFIRATGGLTTNGTIIAVLPILATGISFQIYSASTGAILGAGYTDISGNVVIYSCSTNDDITITGMGVL